MGLRGNHSSSEMLLDLTESEEKEGNITVRL